MGVSYAEIEYFQPPPYIVQPKTQPRFEIEGIHFILLYILALFIMAFSPK